MFLNEPVASSKTYINDHGSGRLGEAPSTRFILTSDTEKWTSNSALYLSFRTRLYNVSRVLLRMRSAQVQRPKRPLPQRPLTRPIPYSQVQVRLGTAIQPTTNQKPPFGWRHHPNDASSFAYYFLFILLFYANELGHVTCMAASDWLIKKWSV